MRIPRALTLALAAALVLAGCADDGEPAEPESTWTPTSTPEAPSTSPAAADSLTDPPKDETPRQFIRRWVALGNHIQRTGDPAPYLAVAGPDCTSCRDFAKQVKQIYDNGGSIETEGERIVSITREADYQWVITTRSGPTRYRESTDGPLLRLPGGKSRSRLYITKVRGQWIVGFTEAVA
ncbi:DUF6318 family protein [Nocardioides sp. SYSU DS0651]|uniref:DUF6318 family protein n=1 Tax=Nocardioides sp. SYSU DS0651 TaxID=3415955 RepID=UPI003F4B6D03